MWTDLHSNRLGPPCIVYADYFKGKVIKKNVSRAYLQSLNGFFNKMETFLRAATKLALIPTNVQPLNGLF